MTAPARKVIAALTLGAALALGALTPGSAQLHGADVPPAEFHFARMIYTDLPQYRRFGGGWWQQDWPRAEVHFLESVRRLTRVDAGEPVAVQLTDDSVFDYPWLYATQVGYWDLSDEEVARLREYLERGGFLMSDDYFGEDERAVFEQTMARVFPDRPIVEIQGDDAVLHVLYTVDEFTQIPGLRHLNCFGGGRGFGRGRGRRGGGGGGAFGQPIDLPAPRWRGIYDDDGRLMVAMNYNQDIGDAWEEADTPCYPEPMTALAYRFGINYIVYAMTH
jgi:hypothetical protein